MTTLRCSTSTSDVPSYMWQCGEASLTPHAMVRLKFIPNQGGQPLRVIAICLPFVYAKSAGGSLTTTTRATYNWCVLTGDARSQSGKRCAQWRPGTSRTERPCATRGRRMLPCRA